MKSYTIDEYKKMSFNDFVSNSIAYRDKEEEFKEITDIVFKLGNRDADNIRYFMSNKGKVFSIFYKRSVKSINCREIGSFTNMHGSITKTINVDHSKGKVISVRRIEYCVFNNIDYFSFKGNISHKDGNSYNLSIDNLFVGRVGKSNSYNDFYKRKSTEKYYSDSNKVVKNTKKEKATMKENEIDALIEKVITKKVEEAVMQEMAKVDTVKQNLADALMDLANKISNGEFDE